MISNPSVRRVLDEMSAFSKKGELLAAYDVGATALQQGLDDLSIQYTALLMLARAGAYRMVEERARQLGITGAENADTAGLLARVEKDRGLSLTGEARIRALRAAAAKYAAGAERFRSAYLYVNAATLNTLIGAVEAARPLAQKALDLEPEIASDAAPADGFWKCATRAEAMIMLRQLDPARGEIARAAGLSDDLSMRATTRRQIGRLLVALDLDPALLLPLDPPLTIHYTGHRRLAAPGEGGAPDVENDLNQEVGRLVQDRKVGFGFGSLAAGADILVVEALLAAGCKVSAVLPCPAEIFARQSVADCGEEWVRRFDNLVSLARADGDAGRFRMVEIAKDHGELDDVAYRGASRLAMGMAAMHAGRIAGNLEQVAIWDGLGSESDLAGTGADVRMWKDLGLGPTRLLHAVKASGRNSTGAMRVSAGAIQPVREQRAILFGDFAEFSKLRDDEVLQFQASYLRRISEVLAQHEADILFRNTWGDAIHAIFSNVAVAAACALAIQECIRTLDPAGFGLPKAIPLRLACHYGPVFRTYDVIAQETTYCGTHLSRCARMEPKAIPGQVFVSEPFVAELMLAAPDRFRCDYVGNLETSKGYGKLPMYSLDGIAPSAG